MLKSLYSASILRFPDEKDNGGSPSETFRTVGEATETATGDEMGTTSGSESASTTDENGGKSMLDAVKEQLKSKGHDVDDKQTDESTSESSTVEDENAEESRSENEHDKKGEEEQTDENENEENGEQVNDKEQKIEKEKVKIPEEKLLSGKDPIPVDRFKEVIDQRNTTREQLKQVQPIVNDWKQLDTFCKQSGISPQQFNEVLQLQALLNTDPVKALPKLKAIVGELEGFTGERLPDDLQKAVDEGELSLKYAKEVAQTRAQAKFGTKKLEHDQQRLQQQQQAQLQQQLNQAATSWETAKRTSDPDYKPKTNGEPDGKWEMVKAQFISLLNDMDPNGKYVNEVKTPAEMTALMDKAYASVDASLKRFTRRPATRKPLRSDGSSNGNERTNGKSIEEQPDLQSAVSVGLKLMGHRF